MSNALLSSKIVINEEPPRIRSFTALPTAVLGMVGIAERGPMDKAVLVTSFDEFVNTFGGYTLESRDTVAAVEGFFEEGGQFLWFVRTARHTDINDPNSNEALSATGEADTNAAAAAPPVVLGNLAAPFSLVDGDTISISLNGAAGVVSTFNAAPATVDATATGTYTLATRATLTSGNSETFALTNGNTLLISVDGEADQTVTFNTADFGSIGAATAAEVAAVILAQTTDVGAVASGGDVVLTNTRSLLNSRTLEVTGGTDAAAFAFPGVAATGTGEGDTVLVSVDGEADQTFTVFLADYSDIENATTAEVAAAMTAQLTDVVASDVSNTVRLTNSRGSGTSFSIEVTGGTATGIAFTAGVQSGTGDAADAGAVSIAELKTLFEADIAGITVTDNAGQVQIAGQVNGAAQTLQVLAVSTLDTKLGLSNLVRSGSDAAVATPTLTLDARFPGEYGNDVTVRIAPASSLEADRFNLLVLEDGFVREQFNNLTMDDSAVQGYVESVINQLPSQGGSRFLQVVDLNAGLGSPLLDRPANGDYPLSGGTNGLTNIGDIDFIGSSVAENGLRALDVAGDLTLLAVPQRATAAVHNAMLTYAEVTRNGTVFAIIDPPAGLTAQEMVEYVESTALLLESSEYGGVYFPRVKVLNPNTTIFGNDEALTVPPSGHIAGVMARTDASQPGGIYQPPAGLTNGRLTSIVGLEILPGREVPETFDVNKRDLLYPKRINPLSELTGGRIIDGVRTLKSTGSFPTVAERRGVIFIEGTVKRNLQPARFRNNDATLRAEITRSIEAFLTTQMRVGAFRSRDPSKAFLVDFGPGLNPPSVVFAGQVVGRLGLATQKPAEFIILTVSQDTRAIEQELTQP